ncbi:MAG: MFS transporter, partial [Micrococcaceae bacterium]
ESAPAPARTRSPWAAFTVCASVAILTILDLVKVNVILTPLQSTLGATTTQTQLIVAGYVLAFGIALVPSGRLGDQWNRKAMFLLGLILFTLASLASALAPTSEALVVARLVQGLAAGVLMPQVLGMIQNLFQGQQRGQAFGIFGASIGFGTAFGPTIGGLFIGILGPELGWRWTFGMNVPLALIIIPLAIRLLPGRQAHERASRDLDLVGVSLLASTVLLVMLPFVLTTGTDRDAPGRWLLLALGAVTATAFIWWERRYRDRGRSPVLDFRLFSYPSYRNGVIITTLWFAAMPATFLVMTLYNQQGLGHSAVVVGMITIPFAIVSAITAWLSGRYTFNHATVLVIVGVGIFLAGLLGLALIARFVDPAHTPWAMAASLALCGAGPGLVMSANQMRTLLHVPLASAGVAGSFQQVGQRLGNAIGVAVATTVFYALVASVPRTSSGLPDPGDPESLAAYRFAFDSSVGVLMVMCGLALVFAIVDHRQRRRETTAGAEDLHPEGTPS